MNWPLVLNFAVALFAVTNPLGNLPIFISYVGKEKPSVQRLLALFLVLTVFVSQLVFLLSGTAILRFFGISLAAFRIAGGILLLLIGINMIQGERTKAHQKLADVGSKSAFRRAETAYQSFFIPLGIPIFVGPASISTAVLYGNLANNLPTNLGLVGAVIAICIVSWLTLAVASWFERILGDLGLEITSRLLGLILAAIGVQFILNGLSEATIGLINRAIINSP
ncbi:MarC family protein [Synechococcus elongatus]|uniref:UPF0056 membrane protein n=1 Tax=Synechococcus elongatus PCC 11802 TaxID=2283154 RepID=A0AAU6R4H0_SYNEL|nr:MarC family protein [Synechococcus elongatus]QFZ91955.1 MarC family protein [Synechococcus elongatus PCC 11802]